MVHLRRTAEESYRPLVAGQNPPFVPFRDASIGPASYHLTLLDCLQGFSKALMHRFYNPEKFDLEDYEHHEKVC